MAAARFIAEQRPVAGKRMSSCCMELWLYCIGDDVFGLSGSKVGRQSLQKQVFRLIVDRICFFCRQIKHFQSNLIIILFAICLSLRTKK
jgi:hypothetical protein